LGARFSAGEPRRRFHRVPTRKSTVSGVFDLASERHPAKNDAYYGEGIGLYAPLHDARRRTGSTRLYEVLTRLLADRQKVLPTSLPRLCSGQPHRERPARSGLTPTPETVRMMRQTGAAAPLATFRGFCGSPPWDNSRSKINGLWCPPVQRCVFYPEPRPPQAASGWVGYFERGMRPPLSGILTGGSATWKSVKETCLFCTLTH